MSGVAPAGGELVGMVLAAGRGSRLAPVTDRWPKPVLPFLGRPLMVWALDALHRAGVARVGVNVHHLGDQVAAVAQGWQAQLDAPRPEIVIVRESVLMGTGGGARGIWEALGRPRGPVAVLNGDIVTDVRLAEHLDVHERSGVAATLLVSAEGEGRIFVGEGGRRVVGLPGRGGPVRVAEVAGEVSFVGASVLSGEAFEELPTRPGCLLRDGLSRRLLAAGRVAVSPSLDRHRDVGTPRRWWSAVREALESGWAQAPDTSWPRRRGRGGDR